MNECVLNHCDNCCGVAKQNFFLLIEILICAQAGVRDPEKYCKLYVYNLAFLMRIPLEYSNSGCINLVRQSASILLVGS